MNMPQCSAYKFLVAGAVTTLAACSGSQQADEDRIASTSQAVFGGRPDTTEPEDAVVAIARASGAEARCGGSLQLPVDRCNGVLVTPTLVLTSKECSALFGKDAALDVYVGRQSSAMRCRYPVLRTFAAQAGNIAATVDGQNLAALELRVPLLTGEATPLRPSLTAFESLATPVTGNSFRYDTAGVRLVGWSAYDGFGDVSQELAGQRQTAELAVNAVARLANTDTRLLLTNAYDQGEAPMRGLGKDDFGGALFLKDRDTQTWLLSGIGAFPRASSPGRESIVAEAAGCSTLNAPGFPTYNVCDGWVDLLAAPTRAWLSDSLRNRYGEGKPRWSRMHAPISGPAERWIGERDYVGACQVKKDADCDHWYDGDTPEGRDTCPNLDDAQQLDSNDNGVGDACETSAQNAANVLGRWTYEADGNLLTLTIALEGGRPVLQLFGLKRVGLGIVLSGQVGGELMAGPRSLQITYTADKTDAVGEVFFGKPNELRYRVEVPPSQGEPRTLQFLDGGWQTFREALAR